MNRFDTGSDSKRGTRTEKAIPKERGDTLCSDSKKRKKEKKTI